MTASARRLESPFSWGFLGILSVALELLLPTCTDACDDPPRYQSMKIKGNPHPPYIIGYQIEYECRIGYKRIIPLIPVSTVCHSNGTWTPLQEACTKKSCQQIEDLVNGEVIYSNGTMEFGSQAHFRCHDGYYLLGPKILFCELIGRNVEWSDNAPTCEKVLCRPPPNIPNGEFTNSHKDTFEYNEIVTYSCRPSGGPDEYSLVGENTLICIGHDQWDRSPPECKVVKCDLPVLQNGRMVSGFRQKFLYKAQVTFECNAGFYLQGSSTIVCQADNTWKPDIPTCVKGTTPRTSSTRRTSSSSVSKPTISTSAGATTHQAVSKPTISTSAGATTRQTEYSTSDDEIPVKDSNLDGGLIAVIVLTIFLAIAVIGTCTYKFLRIRKRR